MLNKVIPIASGLELRIDSDAVWLSCSFGTKKGLINISSYPGETLAAHALRDVCRRLMEEKRAAGPVTTSQHTHPDVGAFDEDCPACLEDISTQNAIATTPEMLIATVLALTKQRYFAQDLLWSVNNLIDGVTHERRAKEAYAHDLQLYESQQDPSAWIASHTGSNSILHLSRTDGWEVEAVLYEPGPVALSEPMTAGMRLLVEAAEDFVAKVESGAARSTRTYNRLKEALAIVAEQHTREKSSEPPESILKLIEAYDMGQFASDMHHLDSMPAWLRDVIRNALDDLSKIYPIAAPDYLSADAYQLQAAGEAGIFGKKEEPRET